MNTYDAKMFRPNKDVCRSWLINNHFNETPAKVALFLPSSELLCIKAALEAGRINSSTRIIAIERNEEIAGQIRQFLHANFKQYYIHTDNAHTLDLKDVTNKFGKIDYAYFDFCGPLSDSLVCWLWYHCIEGGVFNSNAKLAFTFSVGRTGPSLTLAARDNSPFYKWLRRNACYYQDSGLENSLSAPTVMILKNIMGSGCRMDYKKEYRDSRTPMIFIAMTHEKDTSEANIFSEYAVQPESLNCLLNRSRI